MTDPTPLSPGDGSAGRLALSGPASPEIVDLVHAMLESLWTANPDVADSDRMRFELAVIEILGNIVKHAYALDAEGGAPPERRFDVELVAHRAELVATFQDNGQPMPLDLRAAGMPDDLAESGRGIALATAALDALDYARVDGRNLWTLLCRRSP